MKVIFLDIDGVLNRGGVEESMLNADLVRIFQEMLPKTGAKVVISSRQAGTCSAQADR